MTNSTTEAEYIAASESAKKGVWISMFLIELGVLPNLSSPLNLYCNNNGAIMQAKEPRNYQKNICCGSFTSFESLLGEVKSRCARYMRI